MKIKSPVTGLNRVVREEQFGVDEIVDLYKRQMGIDVKRFFRGIRKIELYRCTESDYRFFYPFNVSGDSRFYNLLEKFSWYYMDWKWEHEKALRLISLSGSVLEIGSGNGSFLDRLQDLGVFCEGLEMNESAITDAKKRGLSVYPLTVEQFSKTTKQKFDYICAFQVLEHIFNVRSFIFSSLRLLKKGGILIISVPNNTENSIINENSSLNMPPHHMGLWDLHSLIKLGNIFPLKLEDIYLEPLQPYHRKIYVRYLGQRQFTGIKLLDSFLGSIRLPMERDMLDSLSNFIIGHTILAVYKKK